MQSTRFHRLPAFYPFLFLICLHTLSSGLWAQNSDPFQPGIMRPDRATLQEWMQSYRELPEAAIDETIARRLSRNRLEGISSSLSLLDYLQYTPGERQQGYCGNCWVWSGTGIMEIALAVQNSTKERLSIQFANSCKLDKYTCCGGTLEKYAAWYRTKGFAVPWSNSNASFQDTYQKCENGSSSVSCGSIPNTPKYSITSIQAKSIATTGVTQAAAIANIKNVLQQNKAVEFGFYLANQSDWDQFSSNFWNGQGESTLWTPNNYCGHTWVEGEGGGHAVLIVGYNDEGADTSKHYWTVLNSWGTASGKRPNGLYRLPMYMNYGCTIYDGYSSMNNYIFSTLDVTFSGGGQSCSYSLSTSSRSFSTAGGSDTVNLTTTSGCQWKAMSNNSWITITSGTSGSGSGTIGYTVAANTGTARQGSITAGGKTLTITQEGSGSTTLPNLSPYTPTGWSDSIVISTRANTNTDAGTITADDRLYIDWAVGNDDATISTPFQVSVYLDGVLHQSETINSLTQGYYIYDEDLTLGPLSSGQHTLQILADSSDTILESNESDNAYTRTFEVGSTVGSYTALSNNVPLQQAISGKWQWDGWNFYYADVAPGTQNLAVDLYGLTGDVDMYVGQGTTPELMILSYAFSCASENEARGNEQCSVSLPAGGRWWVAVTNYDVGRISYTIKAQWGAVSASSTTTSTVTSSTFFFTTLSLFQSTTTTSTSLRTTTTTSAATTTTLPGSGTAARSFAGCYSAGSATTVSLTTNPSSTTQVYAVEETPPSGWTISDISHSGSWDSSKKQVKWGPFFDHDPRTLTYKATPPAGESGVKTFTGSISVDGISSAIGGSATIDTCSMHPSDNDSDFRMEIDEVTQYGAAWKNSSTWPRPPNPIPIDYVTRAGYLWKSGEIYHRNPSLACPQCWVPGTVTLSRTRTRTENKRILQQVTMAGSAVRTLPSLYTAGSPFSVSILVTADTTTQVYAVEEMPPTGWTVSGIDNSGQWDGTSQKVKWGPFFDNTSRTLHYTVTPPQGTSGVKSFSGQVSLDGTGIVIGGNTTISDTSPNTTTTTTTAYVTTTTLPGSQGRLYFPKLINQNGKRTSLAVVNLGTVSTQLTFKAYSDNGQLLATGSSPYSLPPGKQYARLIGEILPTFNQANGWLLLESSPVPSALLKGFFLVFDDQLNVMDGAAVSDKTYSEFVLPTADDAEIYLANPSPSSVSYTLEYINEFGLVSGEKSGTIPAMGQIGATTASLRSGTGLSGYFRGRCGGTGVAAVAILNGNSQWTAALSGIDPSQYSTPTQLYAPQFVVNNDFTTTLDVINLENKLNSVRLRLIGENGQQTGFDALIPLPAGGSRRIEGCLIFGVTSATNSYIQLSSSGKFTGSVRFTDPAGSSIGSVLPLVGTGELKTTFSQVAQDATFYTGLAGINPTEQSMNLQIQVFDENGILKGAGSYEMPAKSKFAKVLTQVINGELPSLTRGYFQVTSPQAISTFALFGTWRGKVLAAIPPQ